MNAAELFDPDANVGKLHLWLDFKGAGISPAIEAVLPGFMNPEALAAAMTEDMRRWLSRWLGSAFRPAGDASPGFTVHPRTGIILPRAERERESREAMGRMAAMMPNPEAVRRREEAIDNHPDNGRAGWWLVEDFRREVHVKASSCREAIGRAEASGRLTGCGELDASFLWEQPPEVF